MKILATAARAPNLKGRMWGEVLGDSGQSTEPEGRGGEGGDEDEKGRGRAGRG